MYNVPFFCIFQGEMLIFCRIINIFRLLLYPFLPFFRFTRRRVHFESKNLQEEACQSFRKQNLRADYAFEVSSEGELEQVFPLIEHLLQEKKRVELMFASESVEKKCRRLYQNAPKQMRFLRLPLASFSLPPSRGRQNIASWLSAPTLILCRYDFYPELLLYGCALHHRLILVSATFKNKGSFLSLHFCGVESIAFLIVFFVPLRRIKQNLKPWEFLPNVYDVLTLEMFRL